MVNPPVSESVPTLLQDTRARASRWGGQLGLLFGWLLVIEFGLMSVALGLLVADWPQTPEFLASAAGAWLLLLGGCRGLAALAQSPSRSDTTRRPTARLTSPLASFSAPTSVPPSGPAPVRQSMWTRSMNGQSPWSESARARQAGWAQPVRNRAGSNPASGSRPARSRDGRPVPAPDGRLSSAPDGRLSATPEGRAPSAFGGRASSASEGRPSSAVDGRPSSAPGGRTSSASGGRASSASGGRTSSASGGRASSAVDGRFVAASEWSGGSASEAVASGGRFGAAADAAVASTSAPSGSSSAARRVAIVEVASCVGTGFVLLQADWPTKSAAVPIALAFAGVAVIVCAALDVLVARFSTEGYPRQRLIRAAGWLVSGLMLMILIRSSAPAALGAAAVLIGLVETGLGGWLLSCGVQERRASTASDTLSMNDSDPGPDSDADSTPDFWSWAVQSEIA